MQILRLNIIHAAEYPWQYVMDGVCYITVQTDENIQSMKIVYGDPFWYMEEAEKKVKLDNCDIPCTEILLGIKYYSFSIPMKTHKLRYHFEIILADGKKVFLSEIGVTTPLNEISLRPFYVSYVYDEWKETVPEWAKNMVWYQIFPDRFYNEKKEKSNQQFIPSKDNFYGGTLKGIYSKISYLKDLGIQGIYLNPIFCSNSNHRYDIIDYSKIDETLGNEEDFKELVEALHKAGIRIMLDGVFNHCGWDNPIWQDVRKKGKESLYYNWFYIYKPDEVSKYDKDFFTDQRMKEIPAFESFAFASNMPKWNTDNPEVIEYLVGEAEKWTKKFSIDAWRLDVPDEVSKKFLYVLKQRLSICNPSIYIIGEIWHGGDFWLKRHLFHGIMDYPLYFAVRDCLMLENDSIDVFSQRIANWYSSTPQVLREYQWAFCSNHDVSRVSYYCDRNLQKIKRTYLVTAFLGGNISIYYGDEICLDGGNDPDNRRIMKWMPDIQDFEIWKDLKRIIDLKTRIFSYYKLYAIEKNDSLYFKSKSDQNEIIMILPNKKNAVIQVSDEYSLLYGEGYKTLDGWILKDVSIFISEII